MLSDSEMGQIEERVGHAVSRGLREAMLDPEAANAFWGAFWDQLGVHVKQRVEKHSGRWVVGAVTSILTRGVQILLIGALIYAAGGWQAMFAYFKSLGSGGA